MTSHVCPRCEFIYLSEEGPGHEGPPDRCAECGYVWPAARVAASLLDAPVVNELPTPAPSPPVDTHTLRRAWRRGMLGGLLLASAMIAAAVLTGLVSPRLQTSREVAPSLVDERRARIDQLEDHGERPASALQAAESERDAALAVKSELERARDELEVRVGSWEALHAETLGILRATQQERDALRNDLAALESELADLGRAGGDPWLRRWQVLGPLPMDLSREVADVLERDLFRADFRTRGLTSEVGWRTMESSDRHVSLNQLLETRAVAVCYLVTWIYAPKQQKVQLSLGSDDGCCVWVNKELLLDRRRQLRSASPGQERIAVELLEGWNELRIAVDNAGGSDWGLYAEVRTEDGSKPLSVHASTTPQRRRSTKRKPGS